jgi:glycosyltransferase involved in cell wall biosynthesis
MFMSKSPFFSVIIPTYNRADLLRQSINSVLQQTFTEFEIIVVDNFSSDSTPVVMKNYEGDPRIRYFRNEQNMERAYSRNVGFKNAKGNYLTLLDSDDIIYPNCLRDAYEHSKINPQQKIFHNLYEFIDEEGKRTKTVNFQPLINQYKQICQGNFLSCIGIFLHKDVYEKFLFTEDLKMIGSEDYEIWFRVLAYYNVGRINRINCGIREHEGRSVYSVMYNNLDYQRKQIISMIQTTPALREKYGNYIGYINANYYFHQAIHSLHIGKRRQAGNHFSKSLTNGKGMFFTKRFFAFIKNFFLSFLEHSTTK